MVAAQGFDHGFDGVIEISVYYGKSVTVIYGARNSALRFSRK